MTASLIAICFLCLILGAQAQKNGFRGGSKSYEVHVEASPMGTNLHYELPESKVKAASKQDWLVDNDNAEMLAMNSPVLATVNVKHPKFSMKGQWPGYKTSFKVPKDVSVASKRNDFSKSRHGKQEKIGEKVKQHNADLSEEEQPKTKQTKANNEPLASGDILAKVAGQFLKRRKLGRKSNHEGSLEMLNITRLLLPIGLKNVDLKNPHISKAMKGVIKNARKVVKEAKNVLNDAASFITRVRKLVKVTKDHTSTNRKAVKASVVAKETEKTGSKNFSTNASKHPVSSTQHETKIKNGRLQVEQTAKTNDTKVRQNLQSNPVDQKHNTNAKQGNEDKIIRREKEDTNLRGVSEQSYRILPENEEARKKETKSRVKKRGLPDTLESILSTINGLKNLLKYH